MRISGYPGLYNLIVIRPNIHYRIEYDINLPNGEVIVNTAENLDYPSYLSLTYCDEYSRLYEGITCYVDRDLIEFLKNRIVWDTWPRLKPWYKHTLRYSFLGENHSKIFLTYKDNWIYDISDYNNQSLISRRLWGETDLYLNFAYIPHENDETTIILMNELIFVHMSVEYVWVCAGYVCYHHHSFEQYLLLDMSLNVLLILLDYDIFID
jgi:hypothetical protein